MTGFVAGWIVSAAGASLSVEQKRGQRPGTASGIMAAKDCGSLCCTVQEPVGG